MSQKNDIRRQMTELCWRKVRQILFKSEIYIYKKSSFFASKPQLCMITDTYTYIYRTVYYPFPPPLPSPSTVPSTPSWLGLTVSYFFFSFAKYETVRNSSLFRRVSIVSRNRKNTKIRKKVFRVVLRNCEIVFRFVFSYLYF